MTDQTPSPLRRTGGGVLLALLTVSCFLSSPAAMAGPKVEKVPDFTAPADGEHPRLAFRKAELADLRAKVKTDWGKKVLVRLDATLDRKNLTAIRGRNREVVKEAGYKAAGHALYGLLTEKPAELTASTERIRVGVVAYPMRRTLSPLERISHLMGATYCYDFAYDHWDAKTRQDTREYLRAEAQHMMTDPERGRPDSTDTLRAMRFAAAGTALLAIRGDTGKADADLDKQIDRCEGVVAAWLSEGINEIGLCTEGEAMKHMALGTTVLPFIHANRNVRGRDMSGLRGVTMLVPSFATQVVPGVGMPLLGPATGSRDRSGLLAMSFGLLDDKQMPAAMWLFEQLQGRRFYDIVRPHHAAYILRVFPIDAQPGKPEEMFKDMQVASGDGGAILRSGWSGPETLLLVTQGGSWRLLGMGAHWAYHAGAHAHTYAPKPARMDNLCATVGKAHRVKVDKVTAVKQDVQADQTVTTLKVTGHVSRMSKTTRVKDKETGKKVEVEVPEGGPFSAVRSIAADYSGKSGAPGLFVFHDRVEGGVAEAPGVWVMHLHYKSAATVEGNTFTVTNPDTKTTLRAVMIPLGDAPAKIDYVPCGDKTWLWNLMINSAGRDFLTVMTVQEGKAPEVKVHGKGKDVKVTVGKRTITLDGDHVVVK